MKEKKTILDSALNTISKNGKFITKEMDLEEMIYMLDSIFISKAKTEAELTTLTRSVLDKFIGGKALQVGGGKYRLVATLNPNAIKNRYIVSIYEGETEYRYTALSRGAMKKALEEKIAERKKAL